MKKLARMLVSVLLIAVLGLTTCLFTGVFSSAQAIATDVSVRFAGIDKTDWVTLSGNTIQDAGFKLVVSNMGEKDIVLTDLSHTGFSNITFTNWSEGMTIKAGKEISFGISGDTAADSIFTTTATYHVKKNPEDTSETATAYVWCTSYDYMTGHSEGYMKSGALVLGLKTGLDLYPVNASAFTTTQQKRSQGKFLTTDWISKILPDNKNIYDPTTTTTIYVDGSQYKKWEEFGLTFSFYSMPFDGDTARQIANMVGAEIDLSNSGSTTMTLALNGIEASTLPGGESKVSSSYDGSEGFFLHSENAATTRSPFSGAIPSEAETSIKLTLTGNGVGTLTDNFGGVISGTSANFIATWNITVYNNDKTALRSRLEDLSLEGLNAGSYRGGWNAYERALKAAYQTLGTIQVKAEAVQTALNNLNTAYDNLVDGQENINNNYRYAVVITNHYYYKGNDASNPVAATTHPVYDMHVVNGSTYTPSVLSNGDYSQPINKSRVVESTVVNVDASTNYTKVIDQYYWYVNDARFQTLKKEFNKKPQFDSQGTRLYTVDSWKDYADAISKCEEDLKKDNIFQVDIDADCDAIVEARDNLVREGIDTVWLSEGMAWAEQILYNEYIYDDYYDYYDDDVDYGWDSNDLFGSNYANDLLIDLDDAYNQADELLKEDYTKAETDAAAVELWNAIYALTVVDNDTGLLYESSTNHADVNHYGYYDPFDTKCEDPGLKPLFNDIIDNTSGDYRLNEEEFTSDSWYLLQDALYGDYAEGMFMHARTEEPYEAPDNPMGVLYVPAYSMINNIFYLASQEDYNACRDNLLDKVNHLEYELDFSDLQALKDSVADLELSDYTDTSAAAFDTELQKAEAMLTKLEEPQCYGDEDPISQAEIDAQYAALEAAQNALVLKPYFDIKDTAPEQVEISSQTGYVYGEVAGKTVNEVLADLDIVHDSDDAVVRIFNKNNVEVGRNAKIGTGYQLRLYVDDDVCQTLILVVAGDVNGDALINEADFNKSYDFVTGVSDELTDVYQEAVDVNGDKVFDLSDAVTILMKSRVN